MAENETTTTTTENTQPTQAVENTQTTEAKQDSPLTTEAIERLLQSKIDKATADLGKTIATLKKENEKLKKDSMTAEEVKQYEMSEKEKTLAAKEKDLLDRENRLFAIKAIKEIGLDDGSQRSLSLVDFVMADEQDKITERVKAFNDLVQGFVSAKVDEKFKAIGRTPNGAPQGADKKEDTSIAEKLGKKRAEQSKASNDVLNLYLGGKR